jgi:pectate lyase C
MRHPEIQLRSLLASLVLSLLLTACGDDASSDDSTDGNPITGTAGTTAGVGGSAGAGGVPPAATAGTSGGSAGTAAGGSGSGASGTSGAAGTAAAGRGGSGGSGGSGGAAGTAGGGSPPDAGADDAGDPPDSGGDPEPDAAIGEGGTVSETIVVRSGETFDGDNKRYVADPDTLGDGSQDEGQQPVFILEDGARLINVVLGAPAADGIHTQGDVTLENIVWEDVGEDALTIKESGTVVLNGGSATEAEDKIFQINAASTFRVSNFTARNAGKFIRQNGDTTFRVDVFIDECDISNMDEAIFRTDSSTSTVTMTNTRYSNIGDELFMGVTPANVTEENNDEY